jgi:predicted AAA+ superfamily ATPase
VFKVSAIKKELPKQVNHNTLMNILEYLENSNKIYVGLKGITWVYNTNPKLQEDIKKGTKL